MNSLIKKVCCFAKSNSQLLILSFIFNIVPAYSALQTPAAFSVTPEGEATYAVPVQVPPAKAGIAPAISLIYKSQAGNGVLGQGWSLSGVSQISRCNKTIAQDGAKGGINYDSSDRFCIDGQRLVVINGTYGADSAEYRTELASFSKVVSYGTEGTGPAWFKVWTKSGQIIEYGNTADSRIEAQASTSARAWGVNKISDAKGNYLTISYTEDNASGETFINRVDYTGNAATTPAIAPFASVQFSYAARSDVGSGGLIGYNNNVSKRLTNIKTYHGTTLVKDYRFTYTNNGTYHFNTSNVADGSLLTQIQECDGGTTANCLNPVNVGWTQGIANTTNTKVSFTTSQSWGLPNGAEVVAVGDVNGDNKDDVIYRSNISGTSATLYLAFSTGSLFTSGQVVGTQTGFWATDGYAGHPVKITWPEAFLSDVNGDGLADFLFNNSVRFSTGVALATAQVLLPSPAIIVATGDVNGDGLADVIYRQSPAQASSSCYSYCSPIYLAFSTGSVFGAATVIGNQEISSSIWLPVFIADVNGDGLGDLVGTYAVRVSTGATFSTTESLQFSAYSPYVGKIDRVGDINADGKADLLVDREDLTIYPALSQHLGFSLKGSVLTGAGTNVCSGYAGDGESGVYCSEYTYIRPDIFIADVNGDGLGDLVQGTGVRLSQPSVPDLVTSITGSLSETSTITYKRLSDTGVYVADTNAVYPVRDINAVTLSYVVSAVSSSDGIGGNVTTNYTYGGAKKDLNGRGALGFRWIKASTPDTGIAVTTFKRQDFPFIGLPLQIEKRRISDNALLSVVNTTYAQQLSGGNYFPYATQVVNNEYELNSNLVTNTTTTYQYDTYGNATQIVEISNDVYSKTTTNVYLNSPANWVIGRLLRSTVSAASP